MLKKRQSRWREYISVKGREGIGFGLSLFLVVVFTFVAVFSMAIGEPLQGARDAIVVLTIWGMALAGLVSAWLCWQRRAILGIWLLIFAIWVGVLVLASITQGYGLILGASAFVLTSSVAAQVFRSKQINQVMAVGALVGTAAYIQDVFGPANRLLAPENMRIAILLIAGVTLLIFLIALFWQFRKLSLLSKLLLPIVLLTLFSIGVFAVYNYTMTRQALLEAKNQALKATAQQVASAISAFNDSARTSLASEAKLPEFLEYLSVPESERRGSPEEARAFSLLRLLQSKGYILSYTLLDKSGRAWLRTGFSPEQVEQLPINLGIDIADSGFPDLLLLTGEPYVSPVIFAPNEYPSLYFAARIDNRAGNAVGILVSQYHASNLQAIIAQSNDLVGSGSFAILVDENGFRLAQGADPSVLYKFISQPDPRVYAELTAARRIPDLPINQIATDYSSFQAGLRGYVRSPFFTAQEAGAQGQISSVAVVEVPNRKWKVAFMQPQSVFLQPVESQSQTAILLAIGMAVLISFAVGIVAGFIVQPIIRLTRVAQVVTTGDLTVQAPVTGQDEIGMLSEAFNTMTTQLRQTLEGLEERVRERTQELQDVSEQMRFRAEQLQTVSEVARAIATIQDIDHLLPQITQTISERFGYYHVGIFLLDPNREYAVLRAANSEGGQRMLARGHHLKVGQVGIVGYVADKGVPRIALDVGQDAVFFDNPDLPETRSEMALPLKIGEKVIGVLDVQSKSPAEFKEENIALLTTLADQVAIAIENARLFGETQQALVELQTAQREYLRTEWEKVTTQQDLIGYQYIFGRVVGLPQGGEVWIEAASDQRSTSASEGSQATSRQIQAEGKLSPSILGEMRDQLVIPITLRGQVIGMIKLEDVDRTRTWDEEEISFIKAVADQVGLALENARLLEATQRRAEREYLVGQITTRLRASNDPQVILQTAVTELRKALHAKKAQVILQARPPQEPENTNKQRQLEERSD